MSVSLLCTISSLSNAFSLTGSWSFDYQLVREDISLQITPSSSGAGLAAAKANTNDFGASDNPLTTADRVGAEDLVQFPTVAAAVVMAYNIPGVSGAAGRRLVLTRPILAKIYLGDVRSVVFLRLMDGDVPNSRQRAGVVPNGRLVSPF